MRTRIYLRSHGHNKSSGRVKLKIFENQGITNHSTRPENALQVNYGPRIFCDTSLPEFFTQSVVGRERRERLSQLTWCGGGWFDARRRVNSTVRHHEADKPFSFCEQRPLGGRIRELETSRRQPRPLASMPNGAGVSS